MKPADNSTESWNPGWKFYLVVAIVVYLFFEITSSYSSYPNIEREIEKAPTEWTREERFTYMQSCRNAARTMQAEHNLREHQVNQYCSCSLEEMIHRFPSAPPEAEDLDRATIEQIISTCLNQVVPN